MLNPSIANAVADDATIRRCRGFSTSFGADCFVVINLFAFCATDPKDLRGVADPVGPENDSAWRLALDTRVGPVIVGWGALSPGWLSALARPRVAALVKLAEHMAIPLLCLGTCANGQPMHPLFVSASRALYRWNPKIP